MFTQRIPRCTRPDVFWGEIAPCEHVVQIYGTDEGFLDSLEGFVAGGLKAGEAVIIIVTTSHRIGLEKRLANRGCNIAAASASDQYIALDAEDVLAQFMDRGWPDDNRFRTLITKIIARARAGGRRVRAFGEMVAILWAKGQSGATIQLEHLWNELVRVESLSLFCAYPKSGFAEDSRQSLDEICSAHSKVIEN